MIRVLALIALVGCPSITEKLGLDDDSESPELGSEIDTGSYDSDSGSFDSDADTGDSDSANWDSYDLWDSNDTWGWDTNDTGWGDSDTDTSE